MITSNLTGNLGNHMWIYAITRAVAEHNNYEWGFNSVPEYDYYNGKSQLYFMNIDYGTQHSFKYNETPTWAKNIWEEKHKRYVLPQFNDVVNYYYYQPEVFEIKDNTKLIIGCCQDARYLNNIKNKVEEWFSIKKDFIESYNNKLKEFSIRIDDNLTIINVRGGEYRGVPNLILQKTYWDNAIALMKNKNPAMKFLVITDDIEYSTSLFDSKIPVTHLSIGGDYYILNNAKNIILSNSSFGLFPTWLNKNKPFVIAPAGWARHNIGVWANSDIWSFPWTFIEKDGSIFKKQNESI